MCGIAGYAGFSDEDLLHRMAASLVHRGPDDEGFYVGPEVGLAHRRLSVIDLAGGHQPMANEDGTVWVAFNGEIYNYEDVRERLLRRGHRFATQSDTETIVHAYEEHGLDFARELRGMFAVAIWDTRRRRLVLLRDRIGEKPLYYRIDGGTLLFGSEIKAILQQPLSRAVNPQAVCDFLAMGYVPSPQTFFAGICQVAPGQMLIWHAGQVRWRSYWRPMQRPHEMLPYVQAREELAARLDETVGCCLKSDVEVGGFLSGGVDSSTLVALMRHHAAHVQTFAVGYDGEAAGYNELDHARCVAEAAGTQHHELILAGHSSVRLLPRILWHYDQPHGEPTSVLVYHLCQWTRRFVKVAVGGTGGDEIFLGYPRFAGIGMLAWYRHVPRWVRRGLIERIVSRWPESTRGRPFMRRAKRFVAAAALPACEAYLNWVSLLSREVRDGLIDRAVSQAASDPAGERMLRDYLRQGEGPLLRRAARLDVEGYLPEYQLAYMDRMSMAHGLEVRSPLCDYQLVDDVMALPERYRLAGRRSKRIFKDIARRWVPHHITRRPKVGFDSPIGQWLKGPLREFVTTFLARDQVARTGLLSPPAVEQLLGEHLAGRRNHALALWSIVAVEAWHRLYIEDGLTDGRNVTLDDLRGAVGPDTGQPAVRHYAGRKLVEVGT